MHPKNLRNSAFRRKIGRFAVTMLVSAVILAGGENACTAEIDLISPQAFGFELPAGEFKTGTGETVKTTDAAGNSVIAIVHVWVGLNAILLMPDGQLVSRTSDQFTACEEPFVPAEKEAIAAKLRAEPAFRDFKIRETKRYLYLYNTSEEFATATSRILETMFPGVATYAKSQKIEIEPPPTPMVVIMFRTEDQMQAYRRMPDGVVAYYSPISNRVFMHEESKLTRVRRELGIAQSLSTIAHEGAHQILHNIGVQKRLSRWPLWVSEGLAEFYAPTSVDARLRWKGAGQVNDLRMSELERYLETRAADGADGTTITHTVGAAQLTSTGYASAWSLTHYLAKYQRVEFAALVRELSELEPLRGYAKTIPPGIVPANLDVFRDHFGDDFPEIENRMVRHLSGLPYTDPLAAYPHYLGMLVAPTGPRGQQARQCNTFHSAEAAEKWAGDVIRALPPEQRSAARASVRQFPNRPTAERFGKLWAAGR